MPLISLYATLITLENQRFSDDFRGCTKSSAARNGLNSYNKMKCTINCFSTFSALEKIFTLCIFIKWVHSQEGRDLWFICTLWQSFISKYRSNPPEVFLRKGVLKICSKFTGEQPCRQPWFICEENNKNIFYSKSQIINVDSFCYPFRGYGNMFVDKIMHYIVKFTQNFLAKLKKNHILQ